MEIFLSNEVRDKNLPAKYDATPQKPGLSLKKNLDLTSD
jgi:hypothetical protein